MCYRRYTGGTATSLCNQDITWSQNTCLSCSAVGGVIGLLLILYLQRTYLARARLFYSYKPTWSQNMSVLQCSWWGNRAAPDPHLTYDAYTSPERDSSTAISSPGPRTCLSCRWWGSRAALVPLLPYLTYYYHLTCPRTCRPWVVGGQEQPYYPTNGKTDMFWDQVSL